MEMKISNQISISGDLGSGKTTVSHMIAEKLNFTRFSTGDIQRQLASENNMTTLEFNNLSDTDASIDKLIDDATLKMSKTGDKIVFDSRMAWHFAPNSFSVRLVITEETGAKRIMDANRGEVEQYSDLQDAIKQINMRKVSERNRFKLKYGVDLLDLSNYDLVIDTTYLTPEDVVSLLITQFELWREGSPYQKLWLTPDNSLTLS